MILLNSCLIDLIKEFRQGKKSANVSADTLRKSADTVTLPVNAMTIEKKPARIIPRKLHQKSDNNRELLFSICKFLVENRLANSMADKILKFIQTIVNSYEIDTIQESSISKTTASMIIKNCISATVKEELFQALAKSPYSLLLDESTDSHGASFIAICAMIAILRIP